MKNIIINTPHTRVFTHLDVLSLLQSVRKSVSYNIKLITDKALCSSVILVLVYNTKPVKPKISADIPNQAFHQLGFSFSLKYKIKLSTQA